MNLFLEIFRIMYAQADALLDDSAGAMLDDSAGAMVR